MKLLLSFLLLLSIYFLHMSGKLRKYISEMIAIKRIKELNYTVQTNVVELTIDAKLQRFRMLMIHCA